MALRRGSAPWLRSVALRCGYAPCFCAVALRKLGSVDLLKFAKEPYRHLWQSARFEELNLEVAITAFVASMSGYSAAPGPNRGSRFQIRC